MQVNSFTLTITNFDNSAMVDDRSGEVSRMLREIADSIDEYGIPHQDGSNLVDSNGNRVGNVTVDWDEDTDYELYDSETGDSISADDLGITVEEYEAAIRESLDCGQVEGHIRVGERRVYAAE